MMRPRNELLPRKCSHVFQPTSPAYAQNSCISQGKTAQLIARVYANGSTTPANNITCQVGHLSFSTTTASNIAQIDQNGVATANQPGSTVISASVSNSSSASSAGFFSTCPPTSITLAVPGSTTPTSATVNVNNAQPLVATVKDANGTTLTGISLEFESTTPQTVAGSSNVTPVFPGTAAISAICQPASCNPSPFSQIGYLGNGKPIQSNSVTINTPGTSSTVIFMASTQSQYILPMDFSSGLQSAPVKLPYVPNSMALSLDGGSLYLGSSQGLMTVPYRQQLHRRTEPESAGNGPLRFSGWLYRRHHRPHSSDDQPICSQRSKRQRQFNHRRHRHARCVESRQPDRLHHHHDQRAAHTLHLY